MKNNILMFAKIVNGQEIHCEVRCCVDQNATHIMVHQAAGWKLIRIVG